MQLNTSMKFTVAILLASLILAPPAANAGRVLSQAQKKQQQAGTITFDGNHSLAVLLGSHQLLTAAGTTDCSSALTPGGPKSTMDKAVSIGLQAASAIPGPIGTVAKGLTAILGFVADKSISGRSIYNCIRCGRGMRLRGLPHLAAPSKLNSN